MSQMNDQAFELLVKLAQQLHDDNAVLLAVVRSYVSKVDALMLLAVEIQAAKKEEAVSLPVGDSPVDR